MNYKDKIYYDETNDSDYVPSSSEDELLDESHSYITDEEDYAPTTLPDDMKEEDYITSLKMQMEMKVPELENLIRLKILLKEKTLSPSSLGKP